MYLSSLNERELDAKKAQWKIDKEFWGGQDTWVARTLQFLAKDEIWCVEICRQMQSMLTCERKQSNVGLYMPFPIPCRPGNLVSMDFVFYFSKNAES